MSIYDEYKPLRNFLRKSQLTNGLAAIKWYVNFTQSPSPPLQPDDIEVPAQIINEPMPFRVLSPWQLSILARELIICSEGENGRHDLRVWNSFANALNRTKAFDEYLSTFIQKEDLLYYLSTPLSFQQFTWQENRPSKRAYNRYFQIYNQGDMKRIFEDFFGISIELFFAFSIIVWSNYLVNLGLNFPPEVKFKNAKATVDDYKKFIKNYSSSLEELRDKLNSPSERSFDTDFFLYYDSLKRRPLILMELNGVQSHVCPVPTYLFWRTTDGVFYDLIESFETGSVEFNSFTTAFGDSFSQYIGTLLGQMQFNRKVCLFDADKKLPDFKQPKPDWFLVDNKTVLFIECKTKRMRLASRISIQYTQEMEAEITILAKFVIQAYKAINFAISNPLSFLPEDFQPIAVVVTLEPWYATGNAAEKIDEKVAELARKEGAPILELTKKFPYTILSSNEFENFCLVLKKHTTDTILHPFFTDEKYSRWALDSYLHEAFEGYSNEKLFEVDKLNEALSKLTGQDIN